MRQTSRRHVSASPCLPERQCSFSQPGFSSFEDEKDNATRSALVIPSQSRVRQVHTSDSALEPLNPSQYAKLHSHEYSSVTEDTVSLSSWGGNGKQTPFYDADAVSDIVDVQSFFIGQTRPINSEGVRANILSGNVSTLPSLQDGKQSEPYCGFPLELLESNKENYDPMYSSKTMPRMLKHFGESIGYSSGTDTLSSQQGFGDERKRIQNQRKPLVEDVFTSGGNRTTSMWF